MQVAIFFFAFVVTSCAAQTWTKYTGDCKDISARGSELWCVGSDKNIWKHNGKDWDKKYVSPSISVGACSDGYVWVVGTDERITRFDPTTKKWEKVPGSLKQISGMSKDKAAGVSSAGIVNVYRNNNWTALPLAIKAKWAAMGDGEELWVVDIKDQVYRYNYFTKVFDHVSGVAADNVDVQNPCRIIVTNKNNDIYLWKNISWQKLLGAGKRSTITADKMYTITAKGAVYASIY